MKAKIKLFGVVTLSLALLGSCFSATTFAFGSKTHKKLTELAFNTVGMRKAFTTKTGAEATKEILLKKCVGDDSDGYYYRNFYEPLCDPDEQEHNDNALTRMNSHFSQGLEFWRKNDINEAVGELGRALYYLQNMCCIVHLWGYDYNDFHLLLHVAIEDALDANISTYQSELNTQNLNDFRVNNSTPENTAIYYSKLVYNKFSDLKYEDSGTALKFITLAGLNPVAVLYNQTIHPVVLRCTAGKFGGAMFELAARASCELIYMFFKELGINL